METIRLKQFCTIAETGSIAKSANLLHITSSGLSKSMKILQDQFGKSFLRPVGRGLVLTESGRAFYKKAKALLEMEHQLFYTMDETDPQRLRIGTTEIFLTVLCEHIQRIIHINKAVSILDLSPGQIEQMVANRELDYGITYTPFPTEGIDVIEIAKFKLGCFHLEGHFSKMDLSEIPFAVPEAPIPINPLGIKERDGWIEAIVPRRRVFHLNLLSTAIELTRQGLCAIYIPTYLAASINQKLGKQKLIERALPRALKNEQRVFLITHIENTDQEELNRLKTLIPLMIKGQLDYVKKP